MSQNLSSAAVVIGALRVKNTMLRYPNIHILLYAYLIFVYVKMPCACIYVYDVVSICFPYILSGTGYF